MRILHILLPSAMFLSPARCAFTEASVPPALGLRATGAVAEPHEHGRGAGDPRGLRREGQAVAEPHKEGQGTVPKDPFLAKRKGA